MFRECNGQEDSGNNWQILRCQVADPLHLPYLLLKKHSVFQQSIYLLSISPIPSTFVTTYLIEVIVFHLDL